MASDRPIQCYAMLYITSLALTVVCTSSATMGAGELVFETDVIPLLPPETINGGFDDVTVITPNDIWAVGTFRVPGPGGQFQDVDTLSLTMHYDGTHWNFVASPNPENPVGERDVRLRAVDAISTDNVYTSGSYVGATIFSEDTFVLQGDGSVWEHLPSPGVSVFGFQGHAFHAVHAIDDQNIWFGGYTMFGGGHTNPYMVHYDGSNFTAYILPKAPDTVAAHIIRNIHSLGVDDIWVVGDYGGNAPGGGTTYVAHWDGSSWNHIPTPHPGFGEWGRDLAVIASDDVWLCGIYKAVPPKGGPITTYPLMLHWDGSGWTQFDAPAYPQDLLAIASDDIYATASNTAPNFNPTLLHWDGTSWSIIAELAPPAFGAFTGIDAVSSTELIVLRANEVYRYVINMIDGDLNGDGLVGVADLLIVLDQWGPCPIQGDCLADIDGDSQVGVTDLLSLISNWS